jgi:hypothetical protein
MSRRVGRSLASADRRAIVETDCYEFSVFLVKRAEAGCRIDE